MNVENINDKGEAAVIGTVIDWDNYYFEKGSLIGMSSGELYGSSATGAINNLIRPSSSLSIALSVRGTADFAFSLSRAPTITGSGTVITPLNLDLTKTPGALGASFYYGATLTNTGTTLYRKFIPVDMLGAGSSLDKWALMAGTIYGVQILPHQVGTYNISAEYFIK